jgi:predicted MFS family arabinose efflux permease
MGLPDLQTSADFSGTRCDEHIVFRANRCVKPRNKMTKGKAIAVFAAFAIAYFFSTLVRAVIATLAPTLIPEFALHARDLGLLAGSYFLGFASVQLPLGNWLDRSGPKKVILGSLAVAVAGCLAFALAPGFAALVAARVLCGAGAGACLMAPLTGYRRWFAPASQLRANSWMLMIGSLGMVASTLPVQWLLPLVGWRLLFLGLAGLVALSMLVLFWLVPEWQAPADHAAAVPGYAEVWRDPYFRRMAPVGFFNFGGMVALQTLWAVPWMIRVAGYTTLQAATGLFWINVAMLLTFWTWGLLNTLINRSGWTPDRLITYGIPLAIVILAMLITAGNTWNTGALGLLMAFCVASTVGAFAQPAVGLSFRPELAGRALSAYNLIIFCGIFAVQWGIGLAVDGLRGLGWSEVAAYQGAMAGYCVCCVGAYLHFLRAK